MKYIITVISLIVIISPARAYDIIPVNTKTREIKYSPFYDAIVVWSTGSGLIEFISMDNFNIIKSIPAHAANVDIVGSIIVSSRLHWDEWTSDIFIIDCETEEVEYLCTTDTPVEALKYVDVNTIYYTRTVTPLKGNHAFPEEYWKEYPYDSVLGIIDAGTGDIVAEYPIQSRSERIIVLPDNRILTASLSIVINEQIGVDESLSIY